METTGRLDHVAIAVPDLEAAISTFTSILGRPVTGRERIDAEQVDVAFFDLGSSRLELLQPTAADSPVGRFLSRRGPGLHHIGLAVPDIDAALDRCRAAGLEAVGEAPRQGAGGRQVAFLHPRATEGVLLELLAPRPRS